MGEFLESMLEGVQAGNFTFNFTGGLGIIVYILEAWALYTIAERRGIKKPWMTWIPVVNVWILGSISDQYQYVVKRQVKNKRKVLLGLSIAITAIIIFFLVFAIWGIISGLLMMGPPADTGMAPIETEAFQDLIGVLLLIGLLVLPIWVVLIVYTVFFYMALCDVFRSCDPKNSTLYLVLSLVGNIVVSGAYCIFLMLCKDKDLGMPPRKTEVVTPPEIPEDVPESAEEAPVNTEE